jgi:hypothetical protein
MVLFSFGLAYFLSKSSNRNEFIGTWYFSQQGTEFVVGYSEILTFFNDGTFSKCQSKRGDTIIYTGHWHRKYDGLLEIQIEMITDQKTKLTRKLSPNLFYYCRLAVDEYGYLIMRQIGSISPSENEEIRWHFYSRKTPSQQQDENYETMQQYLNSVQ